MFKNIVQRSKRKYLSFEQRHREILDIAITLFNTRGYRATTTASLAQAAGVSEPILYKHFKNKKELFLECFRSIMKELVSEYRKARNQYAEDEVGYLVEVARIYLRFIKQNPHKSNFLIHLLSYRDNPDFEKAFNRFMDDSIKTIEEVVIAGKKKGVIKSAVNARMLAGMFITQYFSTVVLNEFIDPRHFNEDEFIIYLKNTLVTG
jgi:AcrR family transcriptional regulator